jgi:sarcosine oxidase subunit alpha
MRYHRARGLFCGTGECTHCFLRIDGRPNVRACQTPCREGLWLEDQNAWPSVRHDVLAAGDVVYRNYLDAHTAFIRPRVLKPLFDRIIRGMAGFGVVPKTPVSQRFDTREVKAHTMVVGAGPAGMAAAAAAASGGRTVVLLDRAGRVGGRLAWRRNVDRDLDAWLSEMEASLAEAGVRTLTSTRLVGLYEDAGAVAASPSAVVRIHADRIVLATGARDAYPVFAGSDRAGVMLAAAAMRMVGLDGVLPGRDPVLVGATTTGLDAARTLAAHGVHPLRVYDARTQVPDETVAAFETLGVEVQPAHKPDRAGGRARFRRIRFKTPGGHRTAEGDVLLLAVGQQARSELAQQAGCRLRWQDGHGFTVATDEAGSTSVPHVSAAGGVAGTSGWQAAAAAGHAAGKVAR